MKPTNTNNIIRTHTYWLTPKEYRKKSKKSDNKIKMGDDMMTRTHIYFM